MSIIMGMVCALTAAVQPFFLKQESWMRDVVACETEDCVIVAVVLQPIYTMGDKSRLLSEYARDISERFEKKTIVTQDLSVYMTLCRMQKRGSDKEEEEKLLNKIRQIDSYTYTVG